MKYIKRFEQSINLKDSKFKIGDYVISLTINNIYYSKIEGIIYEIRYSKYFNNFVYYIDEYLSYLIEDDLRLMTPDEIEQYELDKTTKKFNI